ncbi:MAG: Gfo/Idh/MocA family oxidoreductase [Vicinamibacterales bacterium]
MRVLIVGAGSVGKRHLLNLRGLGVAELGMVDARADRREAVAREAGVVGVYESVDAATRDPYDAMVVATPTACHTADAMAGLSAGMHVLMEKPISHELDGVAETLDLARRAARAYMVGYTYRFSPMLQRAKALIEAGTIGRLLFMDVTFSQYLPDWHPWEDYRSWFMSRKDLGGGALLDETHGIDLARWFAGEVRDVFAHVGNLSALEMTADDFAQLLVTFADGAKGSIHLDVFGRRHRRTVDLFGERGHVSCDMSTSEMRVYEADAKVSNVVTFAGERNDMFVAEVRHFLECVAGRAAPCVSGEDALQTLAVALAARASSASGRLVAVGDGRRGSL